VLRAEHVSVSYDTTRPVEAVHDVSLELRRGEVVGIAGESGCGKSTFVFALTRMLRAPARMTDGSITFYGGDDGGVVDVSSLEGEALRAFRWKRVALVFQSAMSSLNPVRNVERQFGDIFRAHAPWMSRAAREARTAELLEMVGIDPRRRRSFPHELSGGMRQRIGIAMALALRPDVVIMDEPTTALDVVVQREILDQLEEIREELNFSLVFVTHDLSLLLEISDRLLVMYAGRVVEDAPTVLLSRGAAHPYSRGLVRSTPELGGVRRELRGIPGVPPDLRQPVVGCPFAARCDALVEACTHVTPGLVEPRHVPEALVSTSQWRVACHLHNEELRPGGPPEQFAWVAHGSGGRVAGAGRSGDREVGIDEHT
jgi:peptide/nickel transport system ATP-binding protein